MAPGMSRARAGHRATAGTAIRAIWVLSTRAGDGLPSACGVFTDTTEMSTSRPTQPSSRAGSQASTQGQKRAWPAMAVKTRVSSRPGGPTTANQAHWRPRRSGRSAPGVVRVSQSEVPSSP